MRVLFLDSLSGFNAEMAIGALCDLGVKPSAFEWELSKLELGDFHLHFERERCGEIEGIAFGIHEGATHHHGGEEHGCCHGSHDHGHDHEHDHENLPTPAHELPHGHSHCCGHDHEHEDGGGHNHDHDHAHGRSHAEVRALIESGDLSPFVKKHALSLFARLAEGRASHGGNPFGTLEGIAGIVCVCAGIEQLGVGRVLVSPPQAGNASAAMPGGAAILAEFGAACGPMPRLLGERSGYGIGSHPHEVLRAVLGEMEG